MNFTVVLNEMLIYHPFHANKLKQLIQSSNVTFIFKKSTAKTREPPSIFFRLLYLYSDIFSCSLVPLHLESQWNVTSGLKVCTHLMSKSMIVSQVRDREKQHRPIMTYCIALAWERKRHTRPRTRSVDCVCVSCTRLEFSCTITFQQIICLFAPWAWFFEILEITSLQVDILSRLIQKKTECL